MLNREEKAKATNLAIKMELGLITPSQFLKKYEKHPKKLGECIDFWIENGYSPIFQNTLARIYLERCFSQ